MTTELGLSNLRSGERIQITNYSIHGFYTVLSNSTLGEQRIIKLRKDGIADDNRYYIEKNQNKLTFTDSGEGNPSTYVTNPGTITPVGRTSMWGNRNTTIINYSDIIIMTGAAVGAAGGKNKSRRNKRNKKSRKNNRKSRKY